MYSFDFVKPSTVAEAVQALAGGEAQALGGGQTLIPTLKQRLADPGTLVSLAHIDEMKYVRQEGDAVVIGGGTTHAMVARAVADIYPGLADLAGRIGDPAVRHRGTIGGSLANNDPSACYPAVALASGATIITDKREIAADDYFEGMFATALDEGEIITGVRFPIPEKAHYAKMPQPASRFPLVAAFVAKYADGVRVGVTGASENGVFRWTEAEQALSSNFSADALSGLSYPEEDMIGDIHGTKAYRAHLVGVMTKRAVQAMS
ncbi:FAD binding domain-containing protein [Pontivivens ytuae]|uniref:Xanthine dehydrogenase family protein subunit M n=1 Tax=Pontivivens ytuae TaxID=2789856 RepID=A0A7S9LT58_9RHOB|nr:xanthine dehydrogenase family protein subunit M [Pontivivens ytuae]QPH54255.1 xanthine dehydrogenase family protein subunit M [Pontivivens ytuae]